MNVFFSLSFSFRLGKSVDCRETWGCGVYGHWAFGYGWNWGPFRLGFLGLAWLGLAYIAFALHNKLSHILHCIALQRERERRRKAKRIFFFFFLYRLHKLFCWGYLALGWCGKGMRKEGVE